MSWIYTIGKLSSPNPVAVFTSYPKMIVWLDLQDLEFFGQWTVYRFNDSSKHQLGQQHFVELGSARFVLDSDRDIQRERISCHFGT